MQVILDEKRLKPHIKKNKSAQYTNIHGMKRRILGAFQRTGGKLHSQVPNI